MESVAKNKILISLLIFLSVIFCSCSQVSTRIDNSFFYVVFDYVNSKDFPETRGAVYIETTDDIRRIDSIIIKNNESNLEWKIDEPFLYSTKERSYTGYSNLISADNTKFPNGFYELKIINKNQEEHDSFFTVDYDTELYNLRLTQMQQKLKKIQAEENICIYTEDNRILYFGNRSEELDSRSEIYEHYNNAFSYRSVWIAKNAVCLFPVEYIIQ
ncbi:MAG: hypothetical protein IKX23_03705 [Treponema sp.]|nr:hypothetical protein [Treponema sp.]